MSTFKGLVKEIPRIRIDYFRTVPGTSPPLACFLSHVHSDHLLGLDSLKSPFVYCSAATRDILLRLEKYGHRMNFARGILECRKQTYKHLKNLLKIIPLETPTTIELSPGHEIQVTLFNANHCIGSVMFLIEGCGKAILYTGDTRSEPWLVNSIARHPVVIPYSSGLKRLDQVYLDTTFAVNDDPYREFPPKADGIANLLKDVARYPENTQFYFNAWTFGYEEIWLALSHALKSPVHLDNYRYGLFSSLSISPPSGVACQEAAIMCGFTLGNSQNPGIITRDSSVRLHSCERGTECRIFEQSNKIVTITPIISRYNGFVIPELGAGGGNGDLDEKRELDLRDAGVVNALVDLCKQHLDDAALTQKITEILSQAARQDRASLSLPNDAAALSGLTDSISASEAAQLIKNLALESLEAGPLQISPSTSPELPTTFLSRSLQVPYSRHSSLSELRTLVKTFLPRDIYPCTVPPAHEWDESMSMEALFGDLYSRSTADKPLNSKIRCAYTHDAEIRALRAQVMRKRKREEDTSRSDSEEALDASRGGHRKQDQKELHALDVSETESEAGSATDSDTGEEEDAQLLRGPVLAVEAKAESMELSHRHEVNHKKAQEQTQEFKPRQPQKRHMAQPMDDKEQRTRRLARIEALEAAEACPGTANKDDTFSVDAFRGQHGGSWSSREGSEEL